MIFTCFLIQVNSMDNRINDDNNGDSKCLRCSSLDIKVIEVTQFICFDLYE